MSVGDLRLDRPLRFDPYFVTARAAVAAGDPSTGSGQAVGVPRTLHLSWGFPAGTDPTAAAADLADAALWLLDAKPASLYALACDVEGPPLLHVNVLATNGALVSLEVTIGAVDIPAQREMHLLASDGEIEHRTAHDDLLWSDGHVEVIGLSTEPAGPAAGQALARAVAASLAQGEPVAVAQEVA